MMKIVEEMEMADSGKYLGWDGNAIPY